MAATRFCERCQKEVPRVGVHHCVKAERVEPIPPLAATPNTLNSTPNRKSWDKRYREAHRGQRSNYMRDYMRKYREAARS
jgi:hypothetical protein